MTWIKGLAGRSAGRIATSGRPSSQCAPRGGSARLEGQLAERPYDLGAGCQAREIRFWIDRRVRGTGQRALEARIQTCDQTIQGLLLARKVTDQHILAGELSPEARLQALPQPLRLLLDTLRLLAYRAETAMTTAVAPAPDNPDTARSLLKSLLQADASLHPDESAGTLTVRLLHQPTRAQDRALAPLARRAQPHAHRLPRHPTSGLVYRMLSDDLPCSASSQPTPANPKPPLPASKLSKPNET